MMSENLLVNIPSLNNFVIFSFSYPPVTVVSTYIIGQIPNGKKFS